jgi:hypothetical protein
MFDFICILIAVFFVVKFFIKNSFSVDDHYTPTRRDNTTIVNKTIHNHLHITEKQLDELANNNK